MATMRSRGKTPASSAALSWSWVLMRRGMAFILRHLASSDGLQVEGRGDDDAGVVGLIPVDAHGRGGVALINQALEGACPAGEDVAHALVLRGRTVVGPSRRAAGMPGWLLGAAHQTSIRRQGKGGKR